MLNMLPNSAKLKTFVQGVQKSCNADYHSEVPETAEFFFCIPHHNTNAD
jgi:hypothetical protein